MSTDSSNPFKCSGPTTLENVVDGLQKVVKSPPIRTGDTSTYHIFIHDEEITLTSAQLAKGPGRFSTLYYDVFGRMLFLQKESGDWAKFAEYIAEISEDGELEETAAVMAADNVFEEICFSFDVTEDKEMLLDRDQCRAMVVHKPRNKTYFVVPAGAMSDLINDCGIKSTSEDIADAMRARGYMEGKTRIVTVRKESVRCWWLLPQAVKAQGADLRGVEV